MAGKLVEAGIGTVEALGSMTPEELEAVPGMAPEIVEQIQQVVGMYYGAFEQAPDAAQEAAPEETAEISAPEQGEPGDSLPPEQEMSPEIGEPASEEQLEQIAEGDLVPEGQADDPAISGLAHASSSLKDGPASEEVVDGEEFDRIKDTDRPA
jgi:hypothetical protein